MFLCFKVGKPMRKSFATGRTSSPAHSYIGRGRQPEYWFAVPQERYGWAPQYVNGFNMRDYARKQTFLPFLQRVDHLYSFFIQWSPDTYGKDAQEQGFVVVEKDELTMIDNFFSDPVPRSWEVRNMRLQDTWEKPLKEYDKYEGSVCSLSSDHHD